MFGWEKWSTWLTDGFKKSLPAGIAKKLAAPVVASGLLSYGLVSVSDAPAPMYGIAAVEECGLWCKSKKWVNRHPAIAGMAAGCAAGSFVPVVGTIVGCATGATVGYTIGSDERAGRQEDSMG